MWIVTYPKGKNWGMNGRIFIPIGQNSFCAEMYAYGWVSKYYAQGKQLERWTQPRAGNDRLDTDTNQSTWNKTTIGDMYREEEETITEEYEQKEFDDKIGILAGVTGALVLIIIGLIVYCRIKYKNQDALKNKDANNGITLSQNEIHKFHRMYVYKNGVQITLPLPAPQPHEEHPRKPWWKR